MITQKRILILLLTFTTTLIMVVGFVHQPGMTWPVQAASDLLNISWWTIDSGGGDSSNADFAVSGTIGQPDPSPGPNGMSGGGFQLTGGFWFSPHPQSVDPELPDPSDPEPPQPQDPAFEVFLPLVTQ